MATPGELATTVFSVQLHLLVEVEARVMFLFHLPAAQAAVAEVLVVALQMLGHRGQVGKVMPEETQVLLLHSPLVEVVGLGL